MPRYVVLLRGINVGKAKRVAMADLRALLGDLGYTDVKTVLNSGNAVLTGAEAPPAEHAVRIEAAIAERLGMDVRTVVLTGDELRSVVEGHPFAEIADNGSRMMAYVYLSPVEPVLIKGNEVVPQDPDRARLGARAAYQWCPDGLMAAPDMGGYLTERLGVGVTARNWNTIAKLAELF
ncbi:DUF1697 domain-containing protein [Pseudonocardia aurantiaca]|uniref:DUF1697 domain-containing protein n=1 Tax=Pseudonocardia aurantiaca TaxID=75290 RepID=A0ABW4FSM1_9PSEU